MGLMALGLKYLAAHGMIPARRGSAARRLRVVESLPLDARRRLVIAQCDGAQHLLLLGVNQDMVVAANLVPPPVSPATMAEPFP
jgi:flagellar biogenesis protein FliO